MTAIAVVIPTLRRPDSLARALRSVLAQDDGAKLIDEIVVVDNSPEGSARETVAGLAEGTALRVRYVHEPRPGVATARNSGVREVSARHVAFLDDDEEAPPEWLARLHGAHARIGADVTFGPVRGAVSVGPPWKRAYLEQFFSRVGPSETRLIDHPYGCGGSIMTRATALAGPAPFDVSGDQVGGEDDRLFAELQNRGARFGWAADAWVLEHAPAHRATVAYTLKRAYGYGQSPSQIAWRSGDLLGVARWMIVGAGQAAVFGAAAGVFWGLGRPRRASALADRAMRGLGKVGWFLHLRFYGAAEARRSARVAEGRAKRVATATNSSQMKSL